MGSNFNFKGFGADPPAETGGNGRRTGMNFPLSRQSSIYSLTFDEFQNTVGGIGMNFGSMNMDELLKNICSAEENQNLGSTSGGSNSEDGNGYLHLQRQGSLTLPRTLSQKTVDEVWHDILKDYVVGKNGNLVVGGGTNMNFTDTQRQPTFGEITLEEFLVRAGVVREEIQLPPKPNNVGFIGNSSIPTNSSSALGFMYPQHEAGLMSITPVSPQKPHQLLQPGLAYGTMKNNVVQNVGLHSGGGLGGMVGFGGNNGVTIATASPVISSDRRINGEPCSLSPVPYVFNGSKKTPALEKVVERRQRRMIKNRESAARSRARKQAYTMELEAEVNKLKEENEALMKKQAEIMEERKNQILEMLSQKQKVGSKRRCLRRSLTGPW